MSKRDGEEETLAGPAWMAAARPMRFVYDSGDEYDQGDLTAPSEASSGESEMPDVACCQARICVIAVGAVSESPIVALDLTCSIHIVLVLPPLRLLRLPDSLWRGYARGPQAAGLHRRRLRRHRLRVPLRLPRGRLARLCRQGPRMHDPSQGWSRTDRLLSSHATSHTRHRHYGDLRRGEVTSVSLAHITFLQVTNPKRGQDEGRWVTWLMLLLMFFKFLLFCILYAYLGYAAYRLWRWYEAQEPLVEPAGQPMAPANRRGIRSRGQRGQLQRGFRGRMPYAGRRMQRARQAGRFGRGMFR